MCTEEKSAIAGLPLVFTAVAGLPLVFAVVGIAFQNQSVSKPQRSNPMDVTRVTIEHVRVATETPFEKVTNAFEQQIGRFDPSTINSLTRASILMKRGRRSRRWKGRAGSCSSGPPITVLSFASPARRESRSSICLEIPCSLSR